MVTSHKPPDRTSTFRFYAELNDFLSADHRQRDFSYSFTGSAAVKWSASQKLDHILS